MTIAALLGRTLPEVLAMPALEIRLWSQYIQARPPNGVEILLAHVCCILAQAHGGKDAKAVTPFDFAPWLEPPEERRKRDYERLMALSAMARHDYETNRAGGDGATDGEGDGSR